MIRSRLVLQRRAHLCQAYHAFTLLETLMAVAIVAMLAVLVVPLRGDEARLRLDAGRAVLMSDIELAQVMSISAPKDRVVVVFHRDGESYWLARASSIAQPITHPVTDAPYVVAMGEDRASGAVGVAMTLDNLDDRVLRFSPYGSVEGTTDPPTIVLRSAQSATHSMTITISPTTGRISSEFADSSDD